MSSQQPSGSGTSGSGTNPSSSGGQSAAEAAAASAAKGNTTWAQSGMNKDQVKKQIEVRKAGGGFSGKKSGS